MWLITTRRETIRPMPTARDRQRRISRVAWILGTLGVLGIGVVTALAAGSLGP
jgi:hypothetical protein